MARSFLSPLFKLWQKKIRIPTRIRGPKIKRYLPPEIRLNLGSHTSRLEEKFALELLRRGIPFEAQVSVAGGRVFAGGAVVDFILPQMKTAIRIQGAYWHGSGLKRASDDAETLKLASLGYRVIDVWEEDIKYRLNWVFDYLIGNPLLGV